LKIYKSQYYIFYSVAHSHAVYIDTMQSNLVLAVTSKKCSRVWTNKCEILSQINFHYALPHSYTLYYNL